MDSSAFGLLSNALQRPDSLNILTYNCFLLPSPLTYNILFWKCDRQTERAELIGKICLQYDICMLQEMWGGGASALGRIIEVSHEINEFNKTSGNTGALSELFDTYELQKKGTGGLYSAWRRSIGSCIENVKRDFRTANFLSNQGVTATMLDVSTKWPKKRILILNSHLTISSNEGRAENLVTIRSLLQDMIWKDYIETGCINLSILLVGDFNIDPKLQKGLYRWMTSMGGRAIIRDLWLPENNPLHPSISTEEIPEEQIENVDGATLEGPHGDDKGNEKCKYPDLRFRLDYILALDAITFTNKDLQRLLGNMGKDETEILMQTSAIASNASNGNPRGGVERIRRIYALMKAGGELQIKFVQVINRGCRLITQKRGQELSDHWGLGVELGISADEGGHVNMNMQPHRKNDGHGITNGGSDTQIQVEKTQIQQEESEEEEEENEDEKVDNMLPHLRRIRK